MEAPVLNVTQKRKSLSDKKAKNKKKSINNKIVLCNSSPHVNYQLSLQEGKEFFQQLNKLFQYKVPLLPKWNQLKKVPPKNRKLNRKQLKIENQQSFKDYFIFGINAVTKAIEKKKVSVIVISNAVYPSILFRHVLEASYHYDLLLREVPNLRAMAKRCFGFPSIIIAFKKDIPQTDPVYTIEQFLRKTCNQHCNSDTDSQKLKPVANESISILSNSESNINSSDTTSSEDEESVDENIDEPKLKCFQYLNRTNINQRCFVPPKKYKIIDFIALNDDEEPIITSQKPVNQKKNNKKAKNIVVYDKLKMKEVVKNENRKNKHLNLIKVS